MSTYRIRPGDTLSALAQRFDTTVATLARTNHLADPNLIIVGRTLHVPDGLERPAKKPAAAAAATTSARPRPRPSAPPRPPANGKPGRVGLERLPRGTVAQYEHFKDLVKQAGGKFKTGPQQFNLVGLRTPTNTNANGGAGKYDDRLAMVWKDAAGRPHVKLLRFNTEPAKDMSGYSADKNGDGRADQGRIPQGYYEYAKSSWKHGFCLRAKSDFRVERDWNHDGQFTESRRTDGGASMLFHQGGTYGTSSAGCQTFPPAEWARFVATLRTARGGLGYTLINR